MYAFNGIPLKTKRLLLRPFQKSDAEALFAVFGDPTVMRHWSTPPWTEIEAAHEMITDGLRGNLA